jgi:hypothetical protein
MEEQRKISRKSARPPHQPLASLVQLWIARCTWQTPRTVDLNREAGLGRSLLRL